TTDLEQLAIDTVRILAVDGVQKANSGHPGMPMGAAPMAHVLWSQEMYYNPKNPEWANRDRFILSAGHGCMLQYCYLHLTGYDLSMDDLKNFRQLHSKTAGHPEYGLAPGIDVTTGPLGQGFANGVGFAIGQKHLAGRYNKPEFHLFDYKIFAICSDGDMMEGVTSEAASLASQLELGNLIYLYDDNHISIEGDTDIAFTEDVAARFKAYGWHVQVVDDGNDVAAIRAAVHNAKIEIRKPSLIKVRTHLAYGSPNKVDTPGAHGSPLGEKEVKLVKEGMGFDPEQFFYVPEEVSEFYLECGKKGGEKEAKWNEQYEAYKKEYPELREHAMGSALNGMALTPGIIPFGATFLIFSEYMRPPIRLAAIMKIKPIFIYTHDSIGLGEDGTTHQPVEQLISLRSIPNTVLIRPADANETAQAWRVAIEHVGGPVILVFTRQGLQTIDQEKYGKATQLEKGAYILSDVENPQLLLIATGSEVELIMKAQAKLQEEGIAARVISRPFWELFEKQDAAYKESVFPKNLKKRLAVEMASTLGWHKYVTDEGDVLGMHTFGESAPAEELYKLFGFTVENVVAKAKALIA
ncbi:MAG: transketolase, partial [Sphingobacteriaceae bacterium]